MASNMVSISSHSNSNGALLFLRSVLICSPWDSTHIHHSLVFLLSFWQWNATIKLDNGTQQRNSEWNSTHIYHTFSCFPLHLLATCNPHAFGFGLVLS